MENAFSYLKSHQTSILTISNVLHEIQYFFRNDPYGPHMGHLRDIYQFERQFWCSLEQSTFHYIRYKQYQTFSNVSRKLQIINIIHWTSNICSITSAYSPVIWRWRPIWVIPCVKKKFSFWARTSKIWVEKLVQMSFRENSTCFT